MALDNAPTIAEGDNYRSYIYGEGEKNTTWRYGAPPNYDLVNKLFEEGRTKVWPSGSLEEKVQNLVKTWEMEMFHKTCWDDYKTVDPKKYTLSLNGRKAITLEEKRLLGGGYNSLLQTSLPEKYRCYNPDVETVDSAQKAFTTTFPRGFALEVLHVYSGPPVIVYKFRHWGFMEGPFQGNPPTGEMIELYGMAIFTVDETMKVEKVEFFYDHGELLGALVKGGNSDSSGSSSCPFLNSFSGCQFDSLQIKVLNCSSQREFWSAFIPNRLHLKKLGGCYTSLSQRSHIILELSDKGKSMNQQKLIW